MLQLQRFHKRAANGFTRIAISTGYLPFNSMKKQAKRKTRRV
jgi:hypothetical protein